MILFGGCRSSRPMQRSLTQRLPVIYFHYKIDASCTHFVQCLFIIPLRPMQSPSNPHLTCLLRRVFFKHLKSLFFVVLLCYSPRIYSYSKVFYTLSSDMKNVAEGDGYGGAITAALYLEKFVSAVCSTLLSCRFKAVFVRVQEILRIRIAPCNQMQSYQ